MTPETLMSPFHFTCSNAQASAAIVTCFCKNLLRGDDKVREPEETFCDIVGSVWKIQTP